MKATVDLIVVYDNVMGTESQPNLRDVLLIIEPCLEARSTPKVWPIPSLSCPLRLRPNNFS